MVYANILYEYLMNDLSRFGYPFSSSYLEGNSSPCNDSVVVMVMVMVMVMVIRSALVRTHQSTYGSFAAPCYGYCLGPYF